MSNGMTSGVPPADGWAGGAAAGAGVCCARVGEVINATAQAARVIETISRILSSQLKSGFIDAPSCSNPCPDRLFQLPAGGSAIVAAPPSLLDLEPGVLDHLAPARLLALNTSIELVLRGLVAAFPGPPSTPSFSRASDFDGGGREPLPR
jgi:hypothetical protein